jgi:hypothetical protein
MDSCTRLPPGQIKPLDFNCVLAGAWLSSGLYSFLPWITDTWITLTVASGTATAQGRATIQVMIRTIFISRPALDSEPGPPELHSLPSDHFVITPGHT